MSHFQRNMRSLEELSLEKISVIKSPKTNWWPDKGMRGNAGPPMLLISYSVFHKELCLKFIFIYSVIILEFALVWNYHSIAPHPLPLPWSPGDIWQHLKTLDCYSSGVEGWVILKSGGWRPGILLNILESTGQAPTTKIFSFRTLTLLLRTPIVLFSLRLGLGDLAPSGSPAYQSCDL